LYTALASFLQARSQQGTWLVRIDDLDTPRNVKGSADLILKSLETFGLHWDESVFYQSQQQAVYQAYLEQLTERNLVYACVCSRKTLADFQTIRPALYPGLCRDKTISLSNPHALRLKTTPTEVRFTDVLQGDLSHTIALQHGDFVLKRKEGIIAYPFAVVIDDYQQKITQVVRGFDLLNNTPAQIYLQQLLNLPQPDYMHVPIIIDRHGNKLSKQTHAQAIDLQNPSHTLYYLLCLLKQQPPPDIHYLPVSELLDWAIKNWQIAPLKVVTTQAV
jgi:glutamyl-Q tRNA(Asp) synthetase